MSESHEELAENDLIKARFAHLRELQEQNVDPYPALADRTHTTDGCRNLWDKHSKEWGETLGSPSPKSEEVAVAGRIIALRSHGGATFADIEDASGKLQLLAQASSLDDKYSLWSLFDLGDFIQASGRLFLTKREELTLHVENFTLLTKSLRPLPDKWSGLGDTEKRYRERYADIIANKEVRDLFRTRSRVVKFIRQYLETADFMEVETPILQPIAGGATARPFITHYHAYDTDVFLRIAPELYHKRLIVGGFERVYEFARCFRNEGVDHSHNPEFTNLEFYAAYWDYEKLMDFAEEMMRRLVKEISDSYLMSYNDSTIDFKPAFERLDYALAVKKYSGVDIYEENEDSLRQKLHELKVDFPPTSGYGKLCDYLFKAKVKAELIQPTFIINHPLELSPLAKKKDERSVQRFQLYVAGEFELCNAFSELNDPVDQRERFLAQAELKKKGDEEAQAYDDDFVRALEYGMPPTAGFGMGIDRLTALLTGSHTLREVILFPYMKPKTESRIKKIASQSAEAKYESRES